MRIPREGLGVVLLLLVAGCGDDDGTGPIPDPCPAGTEADGPACVPIFDDCTGPAEIPILGGGCQTIGVTGCATGFAPDREGGCEPVLPTAACAPGTREVIGQTDCQPVGVVSCPVGFEADGEAGCRPVLPTAPCEDHERETLGETGCQPVGDCGEAPWGHIPVDAQTIFVDAAATPTDADGSAARPFPTLGEALAAAPEDGLIAVAAGVYEERLTLEAPVRIQGRCAALVELRGFETTATANPPVWIEASASGSRLSAVTLTGPDYGLVIEGAGNVTLEEAVIRDTGALGIVLLRQSGLRLERSVLTRTTGGALDAYDSELEVVDSVIREVVSEGIAAYGLYALSGREPGESGRLRLERTVIRAVPGNAIVASGVDVEMVDSALIDNVAEGAGEYAPAVLVTCPEAGAACGSLHVEGSVIARSVGAAVVARGVAVVVERSSLQDIPASAGASMGGGVLSLCDPALGVCGDVVLRDSAIVRTNTVGVSSVGVRLEVTGSRIADIEAPASEDLGVAGVFAARDDVLDAYAILTVRGTLIERSAGTGVAALYAPTTLEDSVVRDAQTGGLDLTGNELMISVITGSLIERNRGFGVLLGEGEFRVRRSVVRDTRPGPDGERGSGITTHCGHGGWFCPVTQVSGSLVAGNRDHGIVALAGSLEVTGTTVRDTTSEEQTGCSGSGITLAADPLTLVTGRLTVRDSRITRNQFSGVTVLDGEASIERTILTDHARATTPDRLGGGSGVYASCDVGCGPLEVVDSLVARATLGGILAFGREVAITGTVVRDIASLPAPDPYEGMFGVGIVAGWNAASGTRGSLVVTGSLVSSCELVGIQAEQVPLTLNAVAIRNVQANPGGELAGAYGLGVSATCEDGACGSVDLVDVSIDDTVTSAVKLRGSDGALRRCRLARVAPAPRDDRFGYGVDVEGASESDPSVVHLTRLVIRDADLAGVIYAEATGVMSACQVSGGAFPVVWTSPALEPTIGSDNVLSGSVTSEATRQSSLSPCAAPPPIDSRAADGTAH